jgi:hypothetical protein
MFRNASLSPDGTYRTSLGRMFDPNCKRKCCEGGLKRNSGFVLWVGNNPSTADGEFDDNTVRRMWAFTRLWEFNTLQIANTNCYRSTDPNSALVPPNFILDINDDWLRSLHTRSAFTVCAWGDKANPKLAERAVRALHPLGPLHALRETKAGNPQHPLYLPAVLAPELWIPKKWMH